MSVVIVVDDEWDEPHAAKRERVEAIRARRPECRCRGSAVIDTDRCLWCGRYLQGLFRPYVTDDTLNFRELERLMRERPHAA